MSSFVVPTETWHLRQMPLHATQRQERGSLIIALDFPEPYIRLWGRTLVLDYKPIAIFGHTALWPGAAEVWHILSPTAYEHPILTCRTQRRLLQWTIDTLHLFRVQATVDEKHELAIRWLQKVGFVVEGYMRSYYAPGTTHLMLGKEIPWPQPH